MVIYLYSLPALLSLAAKLVIFGLAARFRVRDLQSRLFIAAVLFSILLSFAELMVLQRVGMRLFSGMMYYVVCVPMIALFVHLAATISIDGWRSPKMSKWYFLLYGYVVLLMGLLTFTPLVISDIDDFNGYTSTGVQGELYFLFELFVVSGFLAIVLLPTWGLNKSNDPIRRNQCKLWLLVAAPLSLLIITIVILLHYNIHWFNATVTTPLLLAALLAAVGYSVHSSRPVEVGYLFPWSTTRRTKNELYQNLNGLGTDVSSPSSLQFLIDRLSHTLGCSVTVVTVDQILATSGDNARLDQFPTDFLKNVRELTIKRDVAQAQRKLYTLMNQFGVAAIAPFYPGSQVVSTWFLFSDPFGQTVYSKHDFRVIEQLFDRIAVRLLDTLLAIPLDIKEAQQTSKLEQSHNKKRQKLGSLLAGAPDEPVALRKPLAQYLMELEAKIVTQTLRLCRGNQAEAARLLGLKPNTLHYKLKQYQKLEKEVR